MTKATIYPRTRKASDFEQSQDIERYYKHSNASPSLRTAADDVEAHFNEWPEGSAEIQTQRRQLADTQARHVTAIDAAQGDTGKIAESKEALAAELSASGSPVNYSRERAEAFLDKVSLLRSAKIDSEIAREAQLAQSNAEGRVPNK